MSGSDRDLVLALRAELAAIDPARPCDRRAEAIGLATTRLDGPGDARARRDGRRRSLACACASGATSHAPRRRPRAPRSPPSTGPPHPSTAGSPGCAACSCPAARSACPAGAPTSSSWSPADDAPVLADRLTGFGLPAAWRLRRGRGVVTWKNGDTIGLFLRRIGATAALLELEARQVSRALRGDLNRVLNAESANLQRAVGAAGRQVAAIEELEAGGELAEQPHVVRLVAEARRETPEATLAELAERLDLHRSAVQRALERIERLAGSPPDGETPPRRHAARNPSGRDRRLWHDSGPCARS